MIASVRIKVWVYNRDLERSRKCKNLIFSSEINFTEKRFHYSTMICSNHQVIYYSELLKFENINENIQHTLYSTYSYDDFPMCQFISFY